MIFNLFIKSDWMTAVFLLVLLLFAIVKYFYKERLVELMLVFFTKRYLVRFGKDSNLIFNGFNAVLFTTLLLISTVVLYLCIHFYFPEVIVENELLLFLKIFGFIGLYFLVRYVIGLFLATLFQINKLHQSVVFVKMTYLFASSALIFPLLLIVFYVEEYNLLFFQLLLFILGILLITRYVFVMKNNKNIMLSELFYFILYLCALEIAPLLLIIKLIN